uniref:Rho GTPase-activating protein FF domain-containing protein n=1 Tax=Timema cristinae TaxID=61476 RepID=A0A7R9DF93_TIMCR|nr:unnamed protein product [Timema cristinae]
MRLMIEQMCGSSSELPENPRFVLDGCNLLHGVPWLRPASYGIEKEYEQKVIPDGKISIDGFLCVFDVSVVPAAKARKELLEYSTEAFQRLIRSQITDFRSVWSYSSKKLAQHEEYIRYEELFGVDSAQRLFRRHVKKLKDEHLAKRIQSFMDILPDILHEMVPELSNLRDRCQVFGKVV